MHQVLFHVPFLGLPIYGYGAMMVIGVFAAMALTKFLARRSGLDPELFVNAALIALVSGIAGARLSHVLENLDEFTRSDLTAWQNLLNVFNMRSGGLTYYGGFLLAFPLTVLYGVMKKAPIRLGMDIIAPALMIGLGFGRVGCFLNGCCHGSECSLPWAVSFPYYSNAYQDQFADRERPLPVPNGLTEQDINSGKTQLIPPERLKKAGPQVWALAQSQRSRPVHPAQLYSTITAWLLAGLLVAYFTVPHAPGRVFALMMLLEGATRFLLEMLRTEPPVIGRLSLSMVIGLGLVAGGAVLWAVFGRYQRGGDDVVPAGAVAAGGTT
jgi:phosphatidylglycerol---prolipoprotein diacylglyceryl transferase